MQRELTKTSENLLYLISCSLHGLIPEREKVREMDLAGLLKYARFHSLAAITYDALEQLEDDIKQWPAEGEDAPAVILKKWRELRDKAFRKNLMLDAERQKLSAYLSHEKIWHMPLKGIVLKDLYPKQEMRQMADNDILFDASYEKTVKEYFVSKGYKVVSYKKGNHDVYKKDPVYNFEMHTSLFGSAHNEACHFYYRNIEAKLIKKSGSYRYAFTDDDFYIYFVAHAFKHFDGSGTGIRSFVDCYVYQSCKKLDWAYIEAELEKHGILEFEKTFRSVSWKIFGDGQSFDRLTDSEYEMLCDSMYAGTYGTMSGRVEKELEKAQGDGNAIRRSTKIKYLLSRLFPPMSFYKANYPLIYRSKVLIPFFAILRIFKAVILRGNNVLSEARLVHKAGK